MQSPYLRTPQAAGYIQVSRRTLEGLRVRGGGPKFYRPPGSRVVLYSIEDLDAWVRAGRRASTSDNGQGAADE